MEDRIKVTPEQLNSTAMQFSDQAETIRQLSDMMLQIAQYLSQAWTGEAAAVYLSRLRNLEEDIQRMIRLVRDQSQNLQDMARNYRTAESQNEAAAGGLAGAAVTA